MKTEDIIYAAGLFDGEGTVTLTKLNAAERRAPTTSVSSTTYELCSFMKETFGGHIITLSRNVKQGHKQAWHWQVSRNKAIEALRLMLPYLREPEKVRRATLVVERFKEVTPRNGRYTSEMSSLREAFEAEFFINSTKR